MSNVLLAIDAAINLLLGLMLVLRPTPIAAALGVPEIDNAFYPSMLGAVLIGIGIALLVECLRRNQAFVGLGLAGAIAINLSGGTVLGIWLIAGDLSLPLRGWIFLWTLVVMLVGISAVELRDCLTRPPEHDQKL